MITVQNNNTVYWWCSGVCTTFWIAKYWKNKTEKSIEAFSTLLTSVLSFIVMGLIQMIASNTFLNWLQRKDSEVRSLASRKAGTLDTRVTDGCFTWLIGCCWVPRTHGFVWWKQPMPLPAKGTILLERTNAKLSLEGDVAVSILMFFYCLATEVALF